MTLCLAAVCYENNKPRIVALSDWKSESASSSVENQDKLCWIREDWPAFIAGTTTRAIHLKDTYRTYLDVNKEALKTIYRSQVMDLLNIPLLQFKHKLADQFIGSRLGISYDAFLANGKTWFHESVFNDFITGARRVTLDCQLLLPIFVNGDPFIYRISDEQLEHCDHFAAIGSGMDIAEAALCQRKHDESTSLAKTLYHVFEAGKLVTLSGTPGVGKDHTIVIFYPPTEGKGVTVKEIKAKGYKFLEEQFKIYGPKRVGKLSFDEKFLEDADFGEFEL